jgi:two-component system chemotaxis sensor kinase CheA
MSLEFDLQPGDDRLYTDEALEQIEKIEGGLLTLERDVTDATVINEVFRAAHTLKGSAATIHHARMAALTHAMEDIFGAFRDGRLSDLRPFADLLLATVDVLRDLVEEVTTREIETTEAESSTQRLRAAFEAAMAASGHGDRRASRADSGGSGGSGGSGEATSPTELHPDAARLFSGAPGEGPHTAIRCAIRPESEWLGVRLFQLLVEADASGRLVSSIPARSEIEDGLQGTELTMLVRGRADELDDLLANLRAVEEVLAVEPVAAPDATSLQAGAERRQIDLGPEARGIGDDRGLAGERLKSAQQTIRIDVSRLDELMNLVGELVVQKTRLSRHAHELLMRLGDDPLARDADEGSQQFSRIASQLQDQVTGLRMLPIESIFNRFPRVVRDIGGRLGKEIVLDIEGKETELDRSVLEEVGDPLGHLVRNALDHGIETPEERIAAGKSREGHVRLVARHADGQIIITVQDDGRGMDPRLLRESAVRKGLLSAEAAAALTDEEALKLIFAPGFSTAARVTDVSGRGVGMDVVRTNIEKLGGRVSISSVLGKGSRFDLSLPLTLAIVGALLVRSGERVCALPLTGVVETLRLERQAITTIRGRYVITLRGRVVPVEVLDNALGDPPRALQAGSHAMISLVVVRSRDRELALVVDGFVGQQEIVLKTMGQFAGALHGVAGATIMADGRVALVVDIAAVLERHLGAAAANAA